MANQYSSEMPLKKEDIETRRFFVMQKRNLGFTYEEIAEAYASEHGGRRFAPSMLAEDFRIIMSARAKELHEETDHLRASQIYRLQLAAKRLMPLVDREVPSLEAMETLIKLEARIARLLGTDMPSKSEVDDKRRKPELTSEQVKARFNELSERVAARLAAPAQEGLPGNVIAGELCEASVSEEATQPGEVSTPHPIE